MPPNLRSVIERVTRGGRSVVSSRNFSSCPNCGNDSKEAGGRVVAAAGWRSPESRKKRDDLFICFVVGFGLFIASDIYRFTKYSSSLDEQALKAEQLDPRHRLK